MRCDVLTLFPSMVESVLGTSMLSLAQEKGLLDVTVVDIRSFTHDRHRTADDRPYGGGAGMLLKPEPILEAVDSICATCPDVRIVMTSPRGRQFDQAYARNMCEDSRRLVFICGHYEGIDERVRMVMAAEGREVDEVSIGDYVLTGGELAALVMIDASVRLISGVLGDTDSVKEESFSSTLLEYAQYTRPVEFRSARVPDVLLSGHHGAIREWRHRSSLANTYARRPDLLEKKVLAHDDQLILADIQKKESSENLDSSRRLSS
ncbi:MAG: tRNA (guanosine(37)-N1)-methyltransferase TrmD [Nitrospiraceae bacterium]|nr:tRNA (guanosine(37)-N1)-methyltransferase TrmD [Nitrospiraceae bacterium]